MVAQEKTSAKRGLAPALTRGLGILDVVARAGRPVNMTDIADELGIAKSSAHGLLAELVNAGFLERRPDNTYRLGLRLVELANARNQSSELPAEFYAIWDHRIAHSQEAAILAVPDGPDVIYIACRNSPLALGITFNAGMRLPACCTATGKALLSLMSDQEIRAFYEKHELVRLTQNGVADVDALLRQMASIRDRGYSIDDGETRDHMWSVGAPVRVQNGLQPHAAVAISHLRSEMTPEKSAHAGELVKMFAQALSEACSTVR
ncbi:IclR family transcriptional regulator [Castellaniella sp. S9]|uniref:IclR family transcriptional regulator n=1 Tax=Castellaniella sp. S9 TaxID=2993652 RepID=UPI0022B3FA1B|nr:IclR family transcriptional regulator [Castellaniella sp. S9]